MSETPQATSEPRKLPPPLKSSSRVGAATQNNYSPFIEHESDNEQIQYLYSVENHHRMFNYKK